MTSRGLQLSLVVVAAVGLGFSFLQPIYPRDQVLQHIPTVIGLGVLAWLAYRGSLANRSMVALFLLASLHIIGGRYVYTFVPYDAWLEAVFGFRLGESLELERNHYDRFVHLAFGALGVIPLHDVLRRKLSCGRLCRALIGIAVILSLSALYEVVEWMISMMAPADQALRYNGQQGDPWDAQKDMALALLGSVLVSCALLGFRGRPRVSRT